MGHLSAQRNQPQLALNTVREVIMSDAAAAEVELHVAPRHHPSPVFAITSTRFPEGNARR